MTPIVSIVGKAGVGKTTLIEKMIREFNARGIRVAVVKHHAHTTPIDAPGKDSWRFAEAGAAAVVVSSPVEVARFERVQRELTLAEIADRLDVDLVLTEGFKREDAPKVEVSRAELGTELVARPEDVIAVIADHPVAVKVPRFALDDAAGLVSMLCDRYLV